MKSCKVTFLFISMFLVITTRIAIAETITNETVVTMIKAGLGEELILSKIQASPCQFDVSTENILKLKKEGVSEKIIKVMLESSPKETDISEQRTAQIVNPDVTPDTEQEAQPLEKEQKKSGMSAGNTGYSGEDVYYARCNLKVIKGNYITWINWQSTPIFVPAGTKLRVTRIGSKATLVNIDSGSSYTLDIGADGDAFLEKFVTKKPVAISQYPPDIQSNIKNTVARLGMTKEEVYIAMGPPTNILNSRTNNMTYDDIMRADVWVYARKRFGKNIGVSFDPGTGRVNRTEGIWR